MGVPNDGVRDAVHQYPAYRAQAAAADHYQARVEGLGQAEDLPVRSPAPEVRLRDLPAARPDPFRLLFEERFGVPLSPPMRVSFISSE